MITEASETQATAQLNGVISLMKVLDCVGRDDYTADDEARDAITDNALSVDVRSGWNSPGSLIAEEYCILLCTGGPAVRITGELDTNNQPHTAEIQHQDWGTSWQRLGTTVSDDTYLLEYASCFYFGE